MCDRAYRVLGLHKICYAIFTFIFLLSFDAMAIRNLVAFVLDCMPCSSWTIKITLMNHVLLICMLKSAIVSFRHAKGCFEALECISQLSWAIISRVLVQKHGICVAAISFHVNHHSIVGLSTVITGLGRLSTETLTAVDIIDAALLRNYFVMDTDRPSLW